MFSPADAALDLVARLQWGRLLHTPLDPGVWALLQPAGLQNHAPQLCWLADGQLACVWMAGGQEGTAGMHIVWSRLRPGARCWTQPRPLSGDPQRSEQNPLLFRLADGRLQLIHTAQLVRDPDAASVPEGSTFSMQWTARLRCRRQRSGRMAWAASRDLLAEPLFCRHPPQPGPDGGWLLPVYRSLEAGGAFGHDHSLVLPLDAEGRPSDALIPVPESTGRVHGSIVPSADGRQLLQFFRSRLADWIYRSVGSLDGRSWTPPEPIALPNNNSSIQALRLASGRLAMIFNRFQFEPDPEGLPAWGEARWPRTRWPLAIALSDDDGLSWPWIRDIDHGLGFCGEANWFCNGALAYPTLLEGLPGDLHIAYSWAGRAAIRYLCLREEQVLGPGEEVGL